MKALLLCGTLLIAGCMQEEDNLVIIQQSHPTVHVHKDLRPQGSLYVD